MAELFDRQTSDTNFKSKTRRSKVLDPEFLSPVTGHADEAGVDDLVKFAYPRGQGPTSREHRRPKRATTTQRGPDQQ